MPDQAYIRPAPIALRPKVRFVLVNSIDMSRIGILRKAKNRKLSLKLDLPGSSNFSYPMNGLYAENIDKYSTGVLAERFNWRATLAMNAANIPGQVWDPIWSGYVLTLDEDGPNNTMDVGCVGWMQRLNKRLFRKDLNWAATDDALIIRDMIQSINGDPGGPSYEFIAGTNSFVANDGYTVMWPIGASPNTSCFVKWGGTLPNEGAGGATGYAAGTGRNFKVTKYQDFTTPFTQLIAMENGCDVRVDDLTRQLFVYRRYRRDVSASVKVAFQAGPRNVSAFKRTIDGEREVNYFLAEGDAASIPGYAHDTSRILKVGLIEEVQTLSGVTGAGPGGTANPVLLAYAGAEILVRSNGVITYTVAPFNYTPDGSVPEPIVDYRVGDNITAHAYHPPRWDFETQARVFGMEFTYDDNDNELLSQLELTP